MCCVTYHYQWLIILQTISHSANWTNPIGKEIRWENIIWNTFMVIMSSVLIMKSTKRCARDSFLHTLLNWAHGKCVLKLIFCSCIQFSFHSLFLDSVGGFSHADFTCLYIMLANIVWQLLLLYTNTYSVTV